VSTHCTRTDASVAVDREGRDLLSATMRRYMDHELSAFAFDADLQRFYESPDPTVRFVVQALWYHYDDCRDHVAMLSKPEWDYFQRLLLLLSSNHQVETHAVRLWSWTQIVAIACLAGFGWCAFRFGWGPQILVFSIPFGAISIAISLWRRPSRPVDPYEPVLMPFGSFGELAEARMAVPGFQKAQWRRGTPPRRIRSKMSEFRLWLQLYAFWLIMSPIPLLMQAFPSKEVRTRVRAA
jgi:hypothetical protein